MGYKMVFSDMDGTLLWKELHISVENKEAIQKAVEKAWISSSARAEVYSAWNRI